MQDNDPTNGLDTISERGHLDVQRTWWGIVHLHGRHWRIATVINPSIPMSEVPAAVEGMLRAADTARRDGTAREGRRPFAVAGAVAMGVLVVLITIVLTLTGTASAWTGWSLAGLFALWFGFLSWRLHQTDRVSTEQGLMRRVSVSQVPPAATTRLTRNVLGAFTRLDAHRDGSETDRQQVRELMYQLAAAADLVPSADVTDAIDDVCRRVNGSSERLTTSELSIASEALRKASAPVTR